jgi:hypothetical protein
MDTKAPINPYELQRNRCLHLAATPAGYLGGPKKRAHTIAYKDIIDRTGHSRTTRDKHQALGGKPE